MKIELIGDLIDQPDGSAIAQLDVDEEGKAYLMQMAQKLLLLRMEVTSKFVIYY